MTIGDLIDGLVEEFGGTRLGIYILERALVKSVTLSSTGGLVEIDGKLISQFDRYTELTKAEMSECEQIRAAIGEDQFNRGCKGGCDTCAGCM